MLFTIADNCPVRKLMTSLKLFDETRICFRVIALNFGTRDFLSWITPLSATVLLTVKFQRELSRS